MNQIPEIKQGIILLSLNLYAKHWVGIVIQKNHNGINITYMDPEQNNMPILLKEQLIERIKFNYTKHNVTLIESYLEPQRYNNCGPEVIENFILYLTGDKASEDKAIELHSKLFENELLEKGDLKSYLLFGQSTELLGGISSSPVSEFV